MHVGVLHSLAFWCDVRKRSLQKVHCKISSLSFGHTPTGVYVTITAEWPSGLRRWFKAPVSSGAWVRIPLLPGILYCVQKLSITFSYFHYKNLVVTSPPQLMKGLSSYFQGMSPKGWVNMIIGPFYWILKTKPFHGCSKRCIMNIHKGTLGVEPRTCRTAAGCSTTELYPLHVIYLD